MQPFVQASIESEDEEIERVDDRADRFKPNMTGIVEETEPECSIKSPIQIPSTTPSTAMEMGPDRDDDISDESFDKSPKNGAKPESLNKNFTFVPGRGL